MGTELVEVLRLKIQAEKEASEEERRERKQMEKERQEMAQVEEQHKQAAAAKIRADAEAERALRRDKLEFRNRELALRETQEEERSVMLQLLIQQLSKKEHMCSCQALHPGSSQQGLHQQSLPFCFLKSYQKCTCMYLYNNCFK